MRRPTEKWCRETAVRLIRIASHDSDVLSDGVRVFQPGDAAKLLDAAAILDRYGVMVGRKQ